MIDLCVVNYNTKPNLEKLLDTLHSDSTNPKNWKLYITDNGSIDGTVKWIKKHINKYLVDRLLLKKMGIKLINSKIKLNFILVKLTNYLIITHSLVTTWHRNPTLI